MHGRIVHVRSLTPEDETAWKALAARAVEPNPFYEPACVVAAATHQTFGDEISMVFAEEDGRFFAAFPIRHLHRWRNFPYPFVVTQVRRMIYCGTPLVDPERAEEAVGAVLDTLADDRRLTRGRVLIMQQLTEGGPADQAVKAAVRARRLAVTTYESWERGVVNRRATSDYESLQSRKDRAELRRSRRRFADLLGSEPVLVDRSDDPAAVDDFIAMEAAGYKSENNVAVATVEGESEYLKAMCAGFASEGRLRLYSLEAGGQNLAMQMMVDGSHGGIFAVKTTYDEQYFRQAPGVLLHLEAMRLCHETSDADWIDTCSSPEFTLLLRLYPDRRRITSYFVPLGRNPLDRLAVRLFMALQPIHHRIVHAIGSGSARTTKPARNPGRRPAPTASAADTGGNAAAVAPSAPTGTQLVATRT